MITITMDTLIDDEIDLLFELLQVVKERVEELEKKIETQEERKDV